MDIKVKFKYTAYGTVTLRNVQEGISKELVEEIAKYKWDGDNITESNFEVLATNDGMFGWKKER